MLKYLEEFVDSFLDFQMKSELSEIIEKYLR